MTHDFLLAGLIPLHVLHHAVGPRPQIPAPSSPTHQRILMTPKRTMAVLAVGFALLAAARVSVLRVVLWYVAASVAAGLLGQAPSERT